MTAVTPADHRFKVLRSDLGKQDVIELVNSPTASAISRLNQCMRCHYGAGNQSLGDFVAPRGKLKSLKRRTQKEIEQATIGAKQEDESWKLLEIAWGEAHR